jgi:hypothetical protein
MRMAPLSRYARAWSQRQGNFKTPFARTSHLARVRVVK